MRPSRDRAVEWLRVYLAERGAVLSSEVIRDAGGGYQPHRQDLWRAVAAGSWCRCPSHVVDVR